jgi:hypothetical protein
MIHAATTTAAPSWPKVSITVFALGLSCSGIFFQKQLGNSLYHIPQTHVCSCLMRETVTCWTLWPAGYYVGPYYGTVMKFKQNSLNKFDIMGFYYEESR